MQATSSILMIRPVNFAFNLQTAASNAFQKAPEVITPVHANALKEFDVLVALLRANGVEVLVVEDSRDPHTPDSIFPNNWISTHDTGQVFLYPMQAENRRLERKMNVIHAIDNEFAIDEIIDLSFFEKEDKFLEGTGSMVLDRENIIAYACLSPRTHREALNRFAELTGYRPVPFNAIDRSGKPIYHTNVLMCLGDKFAVICADCIQDDLEKDAIFASFEATGKEIIEITFEQMECFAGNMLQLKNKQGEDLLVMSEQAYKSLTNRQMEMLSADCKILDSPLYTIESNGGGSARCMIAEIHLKKK